MKLGLHTQEEQLKALELIRYAGRQAKRAAKDQDLELFGYVRGYLHAIRDLAKVEGAAQLVSEVDRMFEKIKAYWD
jgi:hypothetical protein